jgi:hypothetical protein
VILTDALHAIVFVDEVLNIVGDLHDYELGASAIGFFAHGFDNGDEFRIVSFDVVFGLNAQRLQGIVGEAEASVTAVDDYFFHYE